MDCYDACQGQMYDGNIKGSKENFVTNGKLCVNFANLLKEENLQNSLFQGKTISLDESLNILLDKLKSTTPAKTLFYTGSGNLGLMQSSTKKIFYTIWFNLNKRKFV